ncbi:MAG: CHAT domain-containing protein, partial [Bacteroidota bacterium]
MSNTITVVGRKTDEQEDLQLGAFLNVKVSESIKIDRFRSDSQSIETKEIGTDDILEIELENGEKWWGTLENLKELMPETAQRSADAGSSFELPVSFQIGGSTTRGIGDWILKGLRILQPQLEDMPAKLLIANREKLLVGGGGLFRATRLDQLDRVEKTRDLVVDQDPYLLLIHGTASSTYGSFGGFMPSGSEQEDNESNLSVWHQLQSHYANRILAFEHATLSKNPVENVIDLVKSLPKGIRLHVLTHSRGGLLAELLVRANSRGDGVAFNEKDFLIYEKSAGDRSKDIKQLKELDKLLQKKQIKVEKVIRVACPTAGTTLASRRLDLYLKILVNLVGRIPFLAGNPAYEFLTSFMLTVVKKRTDPSELPGLEAMMPDSPLVRMLNNPEVQVNSSLLAVAGNAKANKFWRTMLVFLTKLFYLEQNDFVVNTPSMYRGVRRPGNAFYFFHQGKEVSHFQYFVNRTTQNIILKGFKEPITEENNFQPLVWREEAGTYVPQPDTATRSRVDKPIVFVLPGIMGSELRPPGSSKGVWLNVIRLALGGMNDLRYDESSRVEPSGLVSWPYQNLLDYLSRSHEVVPFPYDWRLPLEVSAERLATAIKEKLDDTANKTTPIRILAHSMGGLVAHTLKVNHSDVWKRLQERPTFRLVLLGTPSYGSFVIPRVITGEERLIRYLSLLDLRNSKEEILQIVMQFPGLLQLLPSVVMKGETRKADMTYFNLDYWEKLKESIKGNWVLPDKKALEQAANLVKKWLKDPLKNDSSDLRQILYVAGVDKMTPVSFAEKADKEGKSIQFMATARGDGRVTWDTGIPQDLKASHTWYMDTPHGNLANNKAKFNALYELLERGDTDELDRQEPLLLRSGTKDFPLYNDEPEQVPNMRDIQGAALGYIPQEEIEEQQHQVNVLVTNGDLSKARNPVAVGHFKGDGIVSAEAALNHFMGNKLKDRQRLGVYPGDVGTAQVIFDTDNKPPGAIIVGLGSYDQLSPGSLVKSMTTASLELAMTMKEYSEKKGLEEGEEVIPKISTLLIGSGYGNLPLRLAIRSILIGIMNANEQIRLMEIDGLHPIAELEFIEIYERRALRVLRILREMLSEEGGFYGFNFGENRLRREGGERRKMNLMEDREWWSRIKVEQVEQLYKNAEGQVTGEVSLRFMSLTDRARAEENTLSSQQQLLDEFLSQAVVRKAWNEQLAKTLFELLLPNDFKVYASDSRNILWILDEVTASYPWELLHDSYSAEKVPIAVRAGMIRQLVTANYRPDVKGSLQRTALVVGDPDNGGTYVDLPSAREEAKKVGNLLVNNGFQMDTPMIGAKFVDILQALFERPYRILHLAGHGIYEKASGSHQVRAGMVMGETTLLTPAIIKQMTRIPDLVFVNCCFLGRTEPGDEPLSGNRHKLAANLGTQLIREGVRAVVVAGWAVEDSAAQTFALTFYNAMLSGMDFGQSVNRARKMTYYSYPNINTWGAFQCYGDPFFSLGVSSRKRGSVINSESDRIEVIVELENLVSKTRVYTRNQDRLAKSLDNIVHSMSSDLMKDSGIVEAVAEAYGELALLEQAVEYFDRLRAMEDAEYRIKSLEQAENLRSRWAIELLVEKNQPEQARKTVQQALDNMTSLLAIRETSERYSLKGSILKRKAVTAKTKAERLDSLEKAAEAYQTANQLYFDLKGSYNDYPLLNWLRLAEICELCGSKKYQKFSQELKPENLQAYYDNSKLKNVVDLESSN